MTQKIHWLGVGLSSPPGIKYLSDKGCELVVWNLFLDEAKAVLADNDITAELKLFDWADIEATVQAGDIVVSMLPATLHQQAAEMCLRAGTHFVSSSYISPDMQALNGEACDKGLSLINEVGLDPGIDHLFAHLLVENYKNDAAFDEANAVSFRSYCGGFPKIANDFRYKFSWSPLGVLKALASPAQWIEGGDTHNSTGPWDALKNIPIKAIDESFECYPNRDSLPFLKQYEFGENWNVKEFVRGTLRLDGWAGAWQYLFDEMAVLQEGSADAAEARLSEISADLQEKYAYDEGEPDRVVLYVELAAEQDGNTVFNHRYYMDEAGNSRGSAMARLVSTPVALAAESILLGKMKPGVQAAPHDPVMVQSWLDTLTDLGEVIYFKDKLTR